MLAIGGLIAQSPEKAAMLLASKGVGPQEFMLAAALEEQKQHPGFANPEYWEGPTMEPPTFDAGLGTVPMFGTNEGVEPPAGGRNYLLEILRDLLGPKRFTPGISAAPPASAPTAPSSAPASATVGTPTPIYPFSSSVDPGLRVPNAPATTQVAEPLDIRPPIVQGAEATGAPQTQQVGALLDALSGVVAPPEPQMPQVGTPSAPRPNQLPAGQLAALLQMLAGQQQPGASGPAALRLQQALRV